MLKFAKKLEFEYNNTVDDLIPSLCLMLNQINKCVPPAADLEAILFRCKIIITELLTNSIKHAGTASTWFEIEADEHKMIIKKTDSGAPLFLINMPRHQLNGEGDKKLISVDTLNSLYATFVSNDCIHFTCEENVMENFKPSDRLMEHFGILIISKSASFFSYNYLNNSRSNVYTVEIVF